MNLSLSLTNNMSLSGSAAVAFDPLTLSPLAIWDASAGTTGSTDGAAISAVVDQSGNGNDLSQGTGANQPLLRFSGALRAFDFDGTNDGLTTAAGRTWAADVDIFVAMLPDVGETQWVLVRNGASSSFFGVGQNGNASAHHLNAGTPTAVVDGAALATDDRDGLHDALVAGGTAHVMEYRNADLTVAGNDFSTLAIGDFGAFEYAGWVYWIGIFPALSAGDRAKVRTYAGAKAGIVV